MPTEQQINNLIKVCKAHAPFEMTKEKCLEIAKEANYPKVKAEADIRLLNAWPNEGE